MEVVGFVQKLCLDKISVRRMGRLFLRLCNAVIPDVSTVLPESANEPFLRVPDVGLYTMNKSRRGGVDQFGIRGRDIRDVAPRQQILRGTDGGLRRVLLAAHFFEL